MEETNDYKKVNLKLTQRFIGDLIKDCANKKFDRNDTLYVSYLTDLGKLMEGRPEMINDISEDLENHEC
jgi:hypothetical protein